MSLSEKRVVVVGGTSGMGLATARLAAELGAEVVAATVPVARMGTPDDIAHAAVFLMTNRQTTGAVLEVSGGEPLVEPVELR